MAEPSRSVPAIADPAPSGTGARGPRRSLLFVPGADARKIEKARRAGADALILDLEDAVAPGEKTRARDVVVRALGEGGFGGADLVVRVNAPGTPWFDADLEAVAAAGVRAVMVPKVEGPEGLARVSALLDGRRGAGGDPGARVGLLALVESPGGIARAAELRGASARLEALCFGHVDFSREMGLETADAGRGVAYHARCALAIAARASGVAPIDTVYLDVRDERGFREDAALGVGLGYEGKLCIHPAQVAIVNELLTPTPEQVARAQRVLDAWEQARAEGRGVFALDGKMIDAPVIAVQRRILERARRAGTPAAREGIGERDGG